jgi:hypothetical protein
MHTRLEIDPALQNRADLLEIVNASADFLASWDDDPESRVEATWRLFVDRLGQTRIEISLQLDYFTTSRNFLPSQLASTNIHELRMLAVWKEVLRYRLDTQLRRSNELIATMEDE